eukprot:3555552-Amphidinium_carterae.1
MCGLGGDDSAPPTPPPEPTGGAMHDELEIAFDPDEVEAEMTNAVPLRRPEDPTQEEREQHETCGHTPYRSWCAACVA